jgi:hypothetical protein
MSRNKKTGFGMLRAIPADAAESRIIPFTLSSYQKDRHGTVLNQDNWMLDNYRMNPLFAYQHTLSGGMCTDPNPDFVIGKSLKIELDGMGSDRELVADGQFEPADMNPLAEKIFRKILFGSLSRTSVGFLELGEGKFGEGNKARGQENETYFFEGQELLEWSVVNIPSNPGVGARDMVKMMRAEGYSALMYAFKELGGKFRLSQIEQFRVCDILDLLDGKDLDLKETDPDRLRKLLTENTVQKEQIERLNTLLTDRKSSLIG